MRLLLSAVLLLVSAIAIAQDARPYAGLQIGQAKAKSSCDDVTGPGVSCDDTDTAWRIFGGYQFNRNFALELGYADFGEVRASGPGGTVSAEATAFDLVGVGLLPIVDRFSIYGKLGLYRAETEARANTALLTGTFEEKNNDLTFGFGARYDLGNVGLFAQWQRYVDVGGGDIGEDDVDVISLGALFRF
jgi:OOP family OmpA-OmpF porin